MALFQYVPRASTMSACDACELRFRVMMRSTISVSNARLFHNITRGTISPSNARLFHHITGSAISTHDVWHNFIIGHATRCTLSAGVTCCGLRLLGRFGPVTCRWRKHWPVVMILHDAEQVRSLSMWILKGDQYSPSPSTPWLLECLQQSSARTDQTR